MSYLRQLLVKLRSWYHGDSLKTVLRNITLIFLVSVAAGFALDFLTPFSGFWNVARSVVLLPIAATAFMLGYIGALEVSQRLKKRNADWVPLRERYSPKRRGQAAIVLGAVLAACVFTLGHKPGYTLFASLIVAAVISLLAFIRRTSTETNRAQLGTPDPRDYDYDAAVRRSKERREARIREKNNRKLVSRERLLHGRKAADELEDELNSTEPAKNDD